MILAVLTVSMIAGGAIAIMLVDQALRPDMGHFPCAHPAMRWGIRLYALALFSRAASLGVGLVKGNVLPSYFGWDIFFGAFGMFEAHVIFFALLMRAKLPHGVWPRIERRFTSAKTVSRFTKNPEAAAVAADGGSALDILAADGVRVVRPMAGPETLVGPR